MQQVLDNLKEMPSRPGAQDIDLIFLRGIIESPIVRSLAKVGHTPHTHTHISGAVYLSLTLTHTLIKSMHWVREGSIVEGNKR